MGKLCSDKRKKKKAFDKAPQNGLSWKLENIGLNGKKNKIGWKITWKRNENSGKRCKVEMRKSRYWSTSGISAGTNLFF